MATSQMLEVSSEPLSVPSYPSVTHFLFDPPKEVDRSARLLYNGTVSLTLLDVMEKSIQLARKWRQSQWLRRGEIVMILSPSRPEFVVAVFALHLLGCIASPCNPLVKPEEFVTQIKLCNSTKIIAAPSSIDIASSALSMAGIEVQGNIVQMTRSENGRPSLESMSANAAGVTFDPTEWTNRESIALICWSSGTSGPSKALGLSHHNLIANVIQSETLLGDRFNNYKEGRIREHHLDVLPQFHAYGLITVLLAFRTCTPRYIMERFDPDLFAEIVERDHVTFSMLVPPALLTLAKKPSINPKSMVSIKSIASGAASLPQGIRDKLKDKFNIIVTDGYGCTECSPIISAQAPKDVRSGKLGVGPIAPGLSVRIVDLDSGKILGRNQTGEIRVRGPNVFSGYLGNIEATAEAFDSDGFYRTGDVGVIDDDGHICITDRAKDLIKYNGFQISVSEIEALLISHPAVIDAAVVGVYNVTNATEMPKAFAVVAPLVKPSDGLASEVIEYVNDRVANYKKLRGGLEWIDAVPKNASGKILRRLLRDSNHTSAPVCQATSQHSPPTMQEPEQIIQNDPDQFKVDHDAVTGLPISGARHKAHKAKGEKLDGFSNMLLMMDEKSYHAACFSVYTFAEDVKMETIRAFFRELVTAFPKYRQVLINRGRLFGPACWIDHTEVDESKHWQLEDNIHEIDLPAKANGRNALFSHAGTFVASHFDYAKPVWEALLVHNINLTEYNGRAALMIKIHHCFSDGQGMIQSYHSALQALNHDISIDAVQKNADAKQAKAQREKSKPTFSATHKHAWHTIRRLFIAGHRRTFTYTESRGQSRPDGRIYAHSKGVALGDLALVRKAFSTDKYRITLNDVVCAITTLAFRREATRQSSSQAMEDRSIAFLIPVSFRPDYDWGLENYSSGAIAWFRWGTKKERGFHDILKQVHQEMKVVKHSKFPKWGLSTFKHVLKYPINYHPRWPLLRPLYYNAYEKYHVMTNVPGPSVALKFGDVEATSYHVLPPSSPGKASMAIGLVSYAGQFSIAITCDRVSEFRTLPIDLCASFENVAVEVIDEARKRLKDPITPS